MNITIHRESVEGRTRAFFVIKMNSEEKTADNFITLKLTHFRDLKRESGGFGEDWDKINWLIYNAINLNLDSFTIKVDPADLEHYQNYFNRDFSIECENEYFSFNITENLESNEFTIQIQIKK